MTTLERFIQQLADALRAPGPGHTQNVERCLVEIIALNTPEEIGALLGLMDDAADHDDMDNIVHTIERWDPATYCAALVSSVEGMVTVAPRWAQKVVARIMSSPEYLAAFVPAVRRAPASTQAAVREVLQAIGARWPKKEAHAKELLASLSE